jgi:predicted transcriptional regulator
MQVGSICTRHVVTIDAGCMLTEAASLMREQHVGTLVVTCSTAGRTEVCGMVTDRVLVIDALARKPLELDICVADLANTQLSTIAEHAEVDAAVAAMHKGHVRRLLVTSSEGRLCGILSMDDVILAIAGQAGGLAQVILASRDHDVGDRPAQAPARLMPVFPVMGTAARARGAD